MTAAAGDSPAVVARVAKRIDETAARFAGLPYRAAARFELGVVAGIIADAVADGADPWPERVEEYRYLRDLVAELYGEHGEKG
jgi:hypothetical protein